MPINNMIDQIRHELQMAEITKDYALRMHHIERAERQLVELRVYVYRMNHNSGEVK